MTFFLVNMMNTWWTQQKTIGAKAGCAACHLGFQDDSPHIAFGSRHHLREEALNKRRAEAQGGFFGHVPMWPWWRSGMLWNAGRVAFLVKVISAIRLDEFRWYIYILLYMSEILWMILWMFGTDVRAWYRNVLMVGFHFAVWLLAFTPEVCWKIPWHHRAHGQPWPTWVLTLSRGGWQRERYPVWLQALQSQCSASLVATEIDGMWWHDSTSPSISRWVLLMKMGW